ncbi:gastrula zinc finger protein XlCGF57.1-like [Maniola jurtina]|uniref:gastrula zinc finger protein XlCGF57.1-like n=1 Tax=Maniola jurtina TaxID=191418 RepID=UPI001E68F8E4|nr:gastrula zinc finger protein XlCGF57.1-like [Maniola jurtina]
MDQHICRLCNENIGVISLFDVLDGETQLSAKVNYCAKVEVVEGDGLPANICVCCEENLASTYLFVRKCQETDLKLRSLQLTVKQECETIRIVKVETVCDNEDDSFPPDNIFEDPCDSPLDSVKPDEEHPVRTKRKYVRRSTVKRESTKGDPIKCKVCRRKYANRSTLAIHMRSHTNEKPFDCPSCVKRYKDAGGLKRHIERNHNGDRKKAFICEHCGKGFYSKTDCKIHKRVHTGETPYACTHCPAQFTQVGSLRRHILTHTGERSHMCSKCSKKFPTNQQLRKHYLVHTNDKNYKCPICDMPFKYNNNMQKHIRLHMDGMFKKFICDNCGQSFMTKGGLQSHIKRLHSATSGYCSQCSKHFSNLEMHMWKHAGVRPHKCELCPKSFFDLRGLSYHVSFRHKCADKFQCMMNDCTAKFPAQAMLDYHVARYHKSIKPFSCDKCPRRFYRLSDMVRHKRGTHK